MNHWTLDYGDKGRESIRRFLGRAFDAGLMEQVGTPFEIYNFPQTQFVAKGMIADIAIHDKQASDGGRM